MTEGCIKVATTIYTITQSKLLAIRHRQLFFTLSQCAKACHGGTVLPKTVELRQPRDSEVSGGAAWLTPKVPAVWILVWEILAFG
jgi:hypothetical protein